MIWLTWLFLRLAVAVPHANLCQGYAWVQTAKYLGCDAVCERIREWLAAGLGKICTDHSNSGDADAIAWRQVNPVPPLLNE